MNELDLNEFNYDKIEQALNFMRDQYNIKQQHALVLLSQAIGETFNSDEPALITKTGKAYVYIDEENAMRYRTINNKLVNKVLKNYEKTVFQYYKNDVFLKFSDLRYRNNDIFYMKVTRYDKRKYYGQLYSKNNTKEQNYLIQNTEVCLREKELLISDKIKNRIKVGNTIIVKVTSHYFDDRIISVKATRIDLSIIHFIVDKITQEMDISILVYETIVHLKSETIVFTLHKSLIENKKVLNTFLYKIRSVFNFKTIYN